VALNAPKPDEAPSGMRGNRDEAMTVSNVNLYGSWTPQRYHELPRGDL